jgi:hypothetical protein
MRRSFLQGRASRQTAHEMSSAVPLVQQTTPSLYVQYGCGMSVGKGWLNYDSSPTLRLQRIPVFGQLASRAKTSAQFPSEVLCGDISSGPLAPPRSCAGVYASHVLEHLSFENFRLALRHTLEMLRPGGLFRLIVPDLEVRARRYLELLASGAEEANSYFMESAHLGCKTRAHGFSAHIREQFGNSKHLWMWDEPSMRFELLRAGFVSIRRCTFNDSSDDMFKEVEDRTRFLDEGQGFTELAIECARTPE